MEQHSGTLEEAIRLLESARQDFLAIEGPSFEQKQMEGYLVTAISAARSALNIASRPEDPTEVP